MTLDDQRIRDVMGLIARDTAAAITGGQVSYAGVEPAAAVAWLSQQTSYRLKGNGRAAVHAICYLFVAEDEEALAAVRRQIGSALPRGRRL